MIIYLERRNGDVLECYIDLEDFDNIINYKWHAGWRKCINGYYAEYCKYLGYVNGKPKYKTICMHQFILGNEDNVVDHINHNTLDNRRKNLRVAESCNNLKHRNSKNSNNTSGYRNVSWDGHKWLVQLQIDGKNTVLGKFKYEELDIAGAFAKEMREKYYQEFKGKS